MNRMGSVKYGVIPAAGVGARMGYLSNVLPKPLFPMYDRPVIHHVVDNMTSMGVEQIYVMAWYRSQQIKEYFDSISGDLDSIVEVVQMDELPPGIAMSIKNSEPLVDDSFVVFLGDDVTLANNLPSMIETFERTGAEVVEAVVKEPSIPVLQRTCCVTLGDDGRMIRIHEKPKVPQTSYRGCGVYVFSQSVYDVIEDAKPSSVRNEVEITDVIDSLAQVGKAYGVLLDGVNVNINTSEDLLNAWNMYREWRNQQ